MTDIIYLCFAVLVGIGAPYLIVSRIQNKWERDMGRKTFTEVMHPPEFPHPLHEAAELAAIAMPREQNANPGGADNQRHS